MAYKELSQIIEFIDDLKCLKLRQKLGSANRGVPHLALATSSPRCSGVSVWPTQLGTMILMIYQSGHSASKKLYLKFLRICLLVFIT